MKNRTMNNLLASVVLLGAAATGVSALQITYVSNTGNDANPGTANSPCATFAGAYAKTAAGGEIKALNAGNYVTLTNQLTINKSITIDGDGGLALLQITVNTGNVTLRNIDFNTNYEGIYVEGPASLLVENSKFGVSGYGIQVNSSNVNLTVNKSTFSGGIRGVWVDRNLGVVETTLRDITVTNVSGAGAFIESGQTDISNSTVSGAYEGLVADDGGTIHASGDVFSHNRIGVLANTGSTIAITNDDIVDNETGIYLDGDIKGNVLTTGNNRLYGNQLDGDNPTGTITQK